MSDEVLQFRCRPLRYSSVVCDCVWMLCHCPLLVYCRSCVRVSGASDRCVTCNLFWTPWSAISGSCQVVESNWSARMECARSHRQWWWNILFHNSAACQSKWHIFHTDGLRRTSDTACGFWFLPAPFDPAWRPSFREQFAPHF